MMQRFVYNDTEFWAEPAGAAWDILRSVPGGGQALVGAGLFANLAGSELEAKVRGLVQAIYPVGVKVVGPDVAHPNMIGDLKLVGPDVSHPNFINWDHDSVSFPTAR